MTDAERDVISLSDDAPKLSVKLDIPDVAARSTASINLQDVSQARMRPSKIGGGMASSNVRASMRVQEDFMSPEEYKPTRLKTASTRSLARR